MSDPLVARLKRFTPAGEGLDRDVLLFEAGRAAAGVREVIGHGERAIAEAFELAGLFHPFGPRAARSNIDAEPERLH